MDGLQLCDTLFYGIFWATSIVMGIDFVWGIVEIWLKHEPPVRGLKYFEGCQGGVCGLSESDLLAMDDEEYMVINKGDQDASEIVNDLWGNMDSVVLPSSVHSAVGDPQRPSGDREGSGCIGGEAENQEGHIRETMEGAGKVEQNVEHDFRAYLEAQNLKELKHIAKDSGLRGYNRMNKGELVEALST